MRGTFPVIPKGSISSPSSLQRLIYNNTNSQQQPHLSARLAQDLSVTTLWKEAVFNTTMMRSFRFGNARNFVIYV
jgi:hypothetical protein